MRLTIKIIRITSIKERKKNKITQNVCSQNLEYLGLPYFVLFREGLAYKCLLVSLLWDSRLSFCLKEIKYQILNIISNKPGVLTKGRPDCKILVWERLFFPCTDQESCWSSWNFYFADLDISCTRSSKDLYPGFNNVLFYLFWTFDGFLWTFWSPAGAPTRSSASVRISLSAVFISLTDYRTHTDTQGHTGTHWDTLGRCKQELKPC